MGGNQVLNIFTFLQILGYLLLTGSSPATKKAIEIEVGTRLKDIVHPCHIDSNAVLVSYVEEIEKEIRGQKSKNRLEKFGVLERLTGKPAESGVIVMYLSSYSDKNLTEVTTAELVQNNIMTVINRLNQYKVLRFRVGEFEIDDKLPFFTKTTHAFLVFLIALSTTEEHRRLLRGVQLDFEGMFVRNKSDQASKPKTKGEESADTLATMAGFCEIKYPLHICPTENLLFVVEVDNDTTKIRKTLLEKLNSLHRMDKLFKSASGDQYLESMSIACIQPRQYNFNLRAIEYTKPTVLLCICTYKDREVLVSHDAMNGMLGHFARNGLLNDGTSDKLANDIAKVTVLRMLNPCEEQDLKAVGARIYILPLTTDIATVGLCCLHEITKKLQNLKKYEEINKFKGYGMQCCSYPDDDMNGKIFQAVLVVIFEQNIDGFIWTPTLKNSNAEAVLLAGVSKLRNGRIMQEAGGEIRRWGMALPSRDERLALSAKMEKRGKLYGIYKYSVLLKEDDNYHDYIFCIKCNKAWSDVIDPTPCMVPSKCSNARNSKHGV